MLDDKVLTKSCYFPFTFKIKCSIKLWKSHYSPREKALVSLILCINSYDFSIATVSILRCCFDLKYKRITFYADPEVHANINTSTDRICIKCPDNGMSRGCVVVLRSPQDLLSAISLKIRRSDRERCFPQQKSGEYTVAVFKQRINKTLQATPLIVFVVSISPNICNSNLPEGNVYHLFITLP